MAEIERFNLVLDGNGDPRLEPRDKGWVVRYSDHEQALAKARQSERQRVREVVSNGLLARNLLTIELSDVPSPRSLPPLTPWGTTMGELDRGELWVSRTGYMLHRSATCCGPWVGKWPRSQVKAHGVPSFFDAPAFKLCPAVRSMCDDLHAGSNSSEGAGG